MQPPTTYNSIVYFYLFNEMVIEKYIYRMVKMHNGEMFYSPIEFKIITITVLIVIISFMFMVTLHLVCGKYETLIKYQQKPHYSASQALLKKKNSKRE